MSGSQPKQLQSSRQMIIAIDGPAASGKGTIARNVAKQLKLPHLDTGLLYRAVAHAVLETGADFDNPQDVTRIATKIDVEALDPSVLRSAEVGTAASKVAAMPSVRQVLFETQQNFANQPNGAVLDGRDIGTVICPHADVKLYIDAQPDVRAKRRYQELLGRGEIANYEAVLEDIRVRDHRDATRPIAPLRQSEDALLLDTSDLGIEASIAAALDLVLNADKAPGR